KIKDLAVDTPGLADIGQRIQQSKDMLDTFSAKKEIEAEKKVKKTEKKKEKKSRRSKERKNQEDRVYTRSKITRKTKTNVPLTPLLVGGALCLVIIGLVLLYTKDTNTLRVVGRDWQKAKILATQKKFPEADKIAREALSALQTILTPGTEKNNLKAEIFTLLESTELQKGLKGEAKYKETYLPIEEVKQRLQLDRQIATAEMFIKNGSTNKALSVYEEALDFATESGLKKEAQLLTEKSNQLRMDAALDAANRAEHAGEWENAAETYQQALEIAQTLADDKEKKAISQKHAAAAFNHELKQSKKSFTDSQWQQTINMLERAKKLLDENPTTASANKRQELEKLLIRSRLYQMLFQARQAYEKDRSDQAVQIYKKALGLLNTHRIMFGDNYANYEEKISKTVLNIEISKTLNAAVAAENKKKLKTALQHYKSTLKILSAAHLVLDKSLMSLQKNTISKIKSLNAEIIMNKKQEWLDKNFERIFRKAYPASRSSTLTNPEMTLVKKTNNGHQEIYQITCSEKIRRSTYRLELHYQYTPSTDQWSIYRK
ncbi:MAG: hypothetical protein D3923_10525, partial [Candidatus Electrothrix sp. AR3]|nr:hypothetical protein [Candidatus Electrothrix sp. AR3]